MFQVECANGQIGYGRRRRDVEQEEQPNLNKIYEVSMSTIVRVANDNDDKSNNNRREEQVWLEKAVLQDEGHADEVAIAALSEEFGAYKYVDFQEDQENNSAREFESQKLLITILSALIFTIKFAF